MNLTEIIGSTSAISPRTGQKAYSYVASFIEKNEAITVSFIGVTECTSAFCNSFVGKLYMNYVPSTVDTLLTIIGLEANPIWDNKIHNARLLGSNENVRNVRQTNIDELILS
jgi:hypothetical protein